MIVPFGESSADIRLAAAHTELEACNRVIGRYGLALSMKDLQALAVGRLEALEESDRVEFGGGVARELVLAFASSAFVAQSTFVQTILELQELFYEFKNESLEQIPDDELIAKMRWLFDETAHGDMGYLAEALFDGLGRHVREVASVQPDAADPTIDAAAMNAATLAMHRYNVSDWVDDTYSPGWEGSSWLDE